MSWLVMFISLFFPVALLSILFIVDWLQREVGSKPAPLSSTELRDHMQMSRAIRWCVVRDLHDPFLRTVQDSAVEKVIGELMASTAEAIQMHIFAAVRVNTRYSCAIPVVQIMNYESYPNS